MSYQTALTIKETIKNIHERKYLLPSIQREFEWKPEQIERLMDSLMQGYPINAFLFWKVPKEKKSEFKFYDFLSDYHQSLNKHNKEANLNGSEEITAILDGQQRLTSLYIALKGSYSYKLPNKRWDNLDAYPKRKLYLNLLSKSTETGLTYDFKFLTDEEVKERSSSIYWFPVGEILNMNKLYDVTRYISKNIEDNGNIEFVNDTLTTLFEAIHVKPTISYYLEESLELDKVLNIFIRINSGGTILSYSDLLLSFATAQWKTKNDREEIVSFVDEINLIGRGFNISKDNVLKASLVLCDFEDISFKVDNFNKNTMSKIEESWDRIKTAIRLAVELISSFGYCRENVTSYNLIIPIAYYINSIGNPRYFVEKSEFINDRQLIKKWFVASLLRRIFSFSPDGVLKPVRKLIKENQGSFPYDKIVENFRGTNRSLVFTDDDIDNLLLAKYGQGNTLILLSILYPWANLKNNFHIDHIFPKSKFAKNKLLERGIPKEKINTFSDNVHYIGNLQLLEQLPNKEKSNIDFEDWFYATFKTEEQKRDHREKHYIPNVNLYLENFELFFNERNLLLKNALKKELL